MLTFGQYTAAQRKEALEDAERRVDTKRHSPAIELQVKQIKTMPVVFQPRELGHTPSGDSKTVDEWHVKSLTRMAIIRGELDPPLVIKLNGKGFVVVDGHHTLAAYKKAKKDTIKCEWFPGSVREAMDQSMIRNGKDKKALTQVDRQQEGWKRALLGGYTAKQIKDICGISVRQVRYMNAVIERAKERRAFQERLVEATKHTPGMTAEAEPIERLQNLSWQVANALARNVDPKPRTDAERAATLTRALVSKMERKLSEEPHITALALRQYDKDLPKKLMAEWTAMDTVDPAVLEEVRAEWVKRAAAAKERGQRAAHTKARQRADKVVAEAANAALYARTPEERQAAQERLREAQAALKRFESPKAERQAISQVVQ
jgi:ParB-like nuclease domain